MATVTYIIGNGLDLGLGLRTSYRDFYDFVRKHKLGEGNRIYKAIEESPETWSDFELALGEYTHYIDKLPENERFAQAERLHEELEEFRADLARYISDQEKETDLTKLASLALNRDSFYIELSQGQRDPITAVLAHGAGTTFHFVTLNYTRTLEKILDENRVFLTRNSVETPPLHLHGTLAEDMTLGVSDDSQLSEFLTGDERDDLIKPVLIGAMNDRRLQDFRRILEESAVVVLFGTSIGDTDKYIWENVTKWLSAQNNRYLVIHRHNPDYNESVKRSSRLKKRFNNDSQNKLLRFSGLDGDHIEALRKRIFVVHNTHTLFASKDA